MKTVNQIIKEFPLIPRETKEKGMDWYKEANLFATSLSLEYNISLSRAAGVISALSPGNEWSNNKNEAEILIKSWLSDDDYTVHNFRTYGANVAKAIRIMDEGENHYLISGILYETKGYKTQSFFYNIFAPLNVDYVTIDRHMMRYLGEDGIRVKSKKHYDQMADRIKKAAEKLGLLPCGLQAVIWEHQISL